MPEHDSQPAADDQVPDRVEEPSAWREPEPPPPIPESLRRPVARRPEKPVSDSGDYSGMTKAWSVAMEFVFTIVASLLLGWFADRWQGTSPRYTLIGMALGFAFALFQIIRRTLKDEKEAAARKKRR